MSRLRNIERRRRSLGEIREVMNSVKSLAYIETRKLSRLVNAQRAVTEQIAKVAEDFLSFHPTTLPEAGGATKAVIVIGTERGFCGDFNQRLLAELKADDGLHQANDTILLAVGRRLRSVLQDETSIADHISFVVGAGVVEEVSSVLDRAVNELGSLQKKHGVLEVSSLYHGSKGEILTREILPPFRRCDRAQRFTHPPLLNLAPAELLVELADQYLFACLYEILYTSLMNENQHRVTHLGDAVMHLDDRLVKLMHRTRALRQEEITEEIEVILLSTTSPVQP